VIDGRFEDLPLESDSVDYLYSILAFHWTTDVDRSIAEIARVLKPEGEFDLFFTGRHTGREFTRKTTPIFLKYLGARLLSSAQKRQHLTAESTRAAFRAHFDDDRLDVTESRKTYHDDLDGHWSWWVARTAGHFRAMDQHKRQPCDRDIRQAIAELQEDQGIPYTVHLIHVSLQNREAVKSCD
jgi:SAM-dependent methyltransferase